MIICSIYPPEEIYEMMVNDTNKNTDSFQQLMRRLNTIVYHYRNSKGEYKTYTLSADRYKSAEDMIKQAEQEERNSGGSIDEFEPVTDNGLPFND